LRFHLDRQTGGLSRAIERGTKGIEFTLAFMLFSIIPTIIEILAVCVILWALYDIWFALATFVTIGSYILFTLLITEWRLRFRREMNARDQEASTRAIDSLLNFETVKYFGNEGHEARRYDSALARY
jgi:ATP-binding cassette subfamily B protein